MRWFVLLFFVACTACHGEIKPVTVVGGPDAGIAAPDVEPKPDAELDAELDAEPDAETDAAAIDAAGEGSDAADADGDI